MTSLENYVVVPRELLEDAHQAIREGQRYGTGDWDDLLQRLSTAMQIKPAPGVLASGGKTEPPTACADRFAGATEGPRS